MKLLDSNLDNNSLVEMEFVCKKMFVLDTWKNKAKSIQQRYTQQGYLFMVQLGLETTRNGQKSTTMDIMTKKGSVSYFPFHWVHVHVFSFGTLKKKREE
jgi:hypothetical protein